MLSRNLRGIASALATASIEAEIPGGSSARWNSALKAYLAFWEIIADPNPTRSTGIVPRARDVNPRGQRRRNSRYVGVRPARFAFSSYRVGIQPANGNRQSSAFSAVQ